MLDSFKFLELQGTMLNSVDEIIEAVGGTNAASKLAGVVPGCVSNWRAGGYIPAEYFLIFASELGRLGVSFDRQVFSFKREIA